jgi:hypothetical protein
MKRMIIKYIGICVIFIGIIILIFTLTLVRTITMTDMSSLISRYGPNAQEETRIYDNLYKLTVRIGNQRNILAMLLFIVVSISSILYGGILFMWARDIKQTQK